jgi:hypothetical protein
VERLRMENGEIPVPESDGMDSGMPDLIARYKAG